MRHELRPKCASMALLAKIISVDRKNRVISLSIKAKDFADEKTAVKDLKEKTIEASGPTNIGDLIKAKLEEGNN